jgi:hypothetical protein
MLRLLEDQRGGSFFRVVLVVEARKPVGDRVGGLLGKKARLDTVDGVVDLRGAGGSLAGSIDVVTELSSTSMPAPSKGTCVPRVAQAEPAGERSSSQLTS